MKNPSNYQKKLDEITRSSISGSIIKSLVVPFSIVRETPSTKPARDFLNIQYCGNCQISGLTFPKVNGGNYFEAVFLVPHSGVEHLNNPGNMLCLSAEMAAKFMHASFEWIDDIESKIKRFKAETDGGFLVDRQITIRLAGQPEVITWTEQHFMRLKSLWECTD